MPRKRKEQEQEQQDTQDEQEDEEDKEEEEEGDSIDIKIHPFKFDSIRSSDCILIVHENPEKAIVYTNRVLRLFKYEFGTIWTSNLEHDQSLFRFSKRVESFENKSFTKQMNDIYMRQAFNYPVTHHLSTSSTNTEEEGKDQQGSFLHLTPLHFVPRLLVSRHPLLKSLDSKLLTKLNKMMIIPHAFIVLHNCFKKSWPNKEKLNKILCNHRGEHKLLTVISVTGDLKISKEMCSLFDWIFFFEKTSAENLKRWHKNVFKALFLNAQTFSTFMNSIKKGDGIAVSLKKLDNELDDPQADLQEEGQEEGQEAIQADQEDGHEDDPGAKNELTTKNPIRQSRIFAIKELQLRRRKKNPRGQVNC